MKAILNLLLFIVLTFTLPAGSTLSAGISHNPDRADVNDESITSASLTVGTTQVEAKIGATRNAKRQRVLLYNGGTATVYYGGDGVTTTTGVPVFKKQVAVVPVGDAPLYLISASAGQTVIIAELQ